MRPRGLAKRIRGINVSRTNCRMQIYNKGILSSFNGMFDHFADCFSLRSRQLLRDLPGLAKMSTLLAAANEMGGI